MTRPLLVLAAALITAPAHAQQYPKMPSETPATVTIPADTADYTRRIVMIPMRDGIKLNTVILIPKAVTPSAKAAILLTRTPYSAAALTTNANSAHLGSSLYGYDNATDVIVDGGYIRVIQDVRPGVDAIGTSNKLCKSPSTTSSSSSAAAHRCSKAVAKSAITGSSTITHADLSILSTTSNGTHTTGIQVP